MEINYVTTRNHSDLKLSEVLAKIINRAYKISEHGIWKEGQERITTKEIDYHLVNQKFVIAKDQDKIIGQALLKTICDEVTEIGLIAILPEFKGKKIGSKLMKKAISEVNTCTVRLELLTPKIGIHPNKEFLGKWYESIGFVKKRTRPLEEEYLHLTRFLQMPCELTVYEMPNPFFS